MKGFFICSLTFYSVSEILEILSKLCLANGNGQNLIWGLIHSLEISRERSCSMKKKIAEMIAAHAGSDASSQLTPLLCIHFASVFYFYSPFPSEIWILPMFIIHRFHTNSSIIAPMNYYRIYLYNEPLLTFDVTNIWLIG